MGFKKLFKLFRIDILILNADTALAKKYMTEDGFELHTATNYLGHFLLSNLLLPLLLKKATVNGIDKPFTKNNMSSNTGGNLIHSQYFKIASAKE